MGVVLIEIQLLLLGMLRAPRRRRDEKEALEKKNFRVSFLITGGGGTRYQCIIE